MKKMYCLVVTDDFSRFSWVFFLATKDETSEILKIFITSIENLIDLKVKVIRRDNGTEFKNRVMNQLCEMKGIKPALSFIRLFGCLVTILNTIDHLGKFDRKADEGFFVGYSTNSKAFIVFNDRTRIVEESLSKKIIVEENLHVQFSENTPNIAGSGPNWLFDIDALTKSINYKAVVVGNQSNGIAGTKAYDDAIKPRMETVPGKDYILLPMWPADPLFSQSSKDSPDAGFKPSREEEKKDAEDSKNKDSEVPSTEEPRVNQEKDANVNSTNTINTVSPTVNVASIKDNTVDENTVYGCVDDPDIPKLEDIVYSDDDEDVGAEANMNNLVTFMPVSPIPTTRIHKDHPVEQIIRDIHSAPQTRRMIKSPKKVIQALKDTSWIEAMQEELLQNKKDERGIVIKNKARLVAQGYTQEEGIDYDEVFAPVTRIEAIRLFLAYASFKDFVVYQMDVKSAFLYGKIEKEVYVCQPPGFEDPDFPDRVYKVEKALYGLHQAPRAWYETLSTYLLDNGFHRGKIDKTLFIKRVKSDILLISSMGEFTFFLGLQVKQNEDEIFISQDKYVTEILKKFSFSDVKTASTPMETHKPLLKDADGEDLDEHLYRSMIGSLMYLTSSRANIMFAVCACARFQVNPKSLHLHAVKRIFRYLKGQPKLGLWYPKESPFDLVAYTNSEYAGASLDRKSTIGGALDSKQLMDYGYNFMQTKIHIDNESTICIVKNPVFHSKTKYIEIRHHFIRDSYEKKLIQMIKIHTDQNVADLLTKAFDTIWNGMKEMLRMKLDSGILSKQKTVNREVQLQALVDKKKVIITESTIRRDLQLKDANGVDFLPNAIIFEQLTLMGIYVTPSHTKKIFANMKREGKGFSGTITPLFQTIMVQAQEEMGEGSANPTNPYHTPIIPQPLTSQPQKKKKPRKSKRKDTEIPQSSGPTKPIADKAANEENVPTHSNDLLLSGKDSLKLNELMELCTILQKKVLDLETSKTTQALEIESLKRRVKKLKKKQRSRTHKLRRLYKVGLSAKVVSSDDEASLGDHEDASKQRRKIYDIDVDEDITLDSTHFDTDPDMFGVHDLHGDEVFVETEERVVNTATTTSIIPVSAAKDLSDVDLTLAQALAELKNTKLKAVTTTTTTTTTRILLQEPSETRTTTTTTIPSKDKGKGIMVEEPLKKKEQIRLDEELTLKIQAEEEEQARLAREKAKKDKEANISWDNVLFVELLEKRKKHFATLRAQEKRNKPPTKAQKKSTMSTYLKHMASYKQSQLKNKSFAEIQKLFDKAMTSVNMLVDIDNDDQEEAEMKKLIEVVPDEEEVAIDAIPLAIKPSCIIDWKIIKEGKLGYYQIIRADGSSKRVHFVRFQDMYLFMLVEKRYPLTPATIIEMLNKKLQTDHLNEMCYHLFKLMTKQLKKQ
ncbi:putative ribonuclease H-like domain-containing protein [Tanacetum coccineum]